MKKQESKASFIGGQIKKAREEEGLSQLDLAKLLDFESATAISLIEKGDRRLTTENLEKLADILHRPIAYFLGRDEEQITVKMALRADANFSKEDREAIEKFVDFIKNKK